MSEKAFTMTSNRYCGDCGSFDLVRGRRRRVGRPAQWPKSEIYCFGCGKHFIDKDFAYNAIRTVPLTVDDFFFQTNLRTQQLKKKQIQPLTHVLGLGLILGAVTVLFLLPSRSRQQDMPLIEWASSSIVRSYESDVVKALQSEFDQLIKAK